ncbi:hypothetical protein AVEN_80712-1 [Araneus ventricosus]|uniref:Uncharacterized protein n=1 Tax=Araneus ventricosus TaxID=182803 RepID=A0A4Y2GXZ8_ARAVE|nr:hypothetical protein AVEN_80712-1 [Araneus ventricosus]
MELPPACWKVRSQMKNGRHESIRKPNGHRRPWPNHLPKRYIPSSEWRIPTKTKERLIRPEPCRNVSEHSLPPQVVVREENKFPMDRRAIVLFERVFGTFFWDTLEIPCFISGFKKGLLELVDTVLWEENMLLVLLGLVR